jgi:hypothetical protein
MATGISTQDKALKINLDSKIYGSFAEIGAGQEVARWFFRAGAASKTIAKTISAYDMTVSDSIYGPDKSGRYVCESRLVKMLDYEYGLLKERLAQKRASSTTFFTFADTVAATSFKKSDQEGRGWIGVRFQREINGEANEIVMHVRFFDKDALIQQEELGVIGVNLIYGAFYLIDSPDEFLASLTDGIKENSIEIEMIRVSGPDVKHVDNRLLAMGLIEQGHTNAILFNPKGEVVQPSEVLYHKNVIVQRGSFRPFTLLHQDMMLKGREQFCDEKGGCDIANTILLMEMTTKNLSDQGYINYQDYLDRVEMLTALGHHVLISEYSEYYKLRQYLGRYTTEKMGILMGAIHLEGLFDPSYYKDLKGGILEAFGLLLTGSVKLYIYPAKNKDGTLLTLETFRPKKDVEGLFNHLLQNGMILDLKNVDDTYLSIFSREVAKKIESGNSSWEKDVPAKAADVIKSRGLFK